VRHEQELEREIRSKLYAIEKERNEFLIRPISEGAANEVVIEVRGWSCAEVKRNRW
jgi:hypothetical protein